MNLTNILLEGITFEELPEITCKKARVNAVNLINSVLTVECNKIEILKGLKENILDEIDKNETACKTVISNSVNKNFLAKENRAWIENLQERVEDLKNTKPFKFNDFHMTILVIIACFLIVFSIFVGAPIFITIGIATLAGLFELTKIGLEKKMANTILEMTRLKVEKDIEILSFKQEALKKLEKSLTSNKMLLEHEFNIKLALDEALKAVNERLNYETNIMQSNEFNVEEKAKSYKKV